MTIARRDYNAPATGPPDFERARARHQQARAAGMHPDYWYPVEYDRAVKPGQVIEVVFWKRPIAVFRGADGALRAIDNRCAHRQLKLSKGRVDGCNLVCMYHGWGHDGAGRVVDIPHDTFGRGIPNARVGHYPVAERYGLIWIFPGDPALAGVRSIPEIPELTGPSRWGCVPVDAEWRGHHSMIIDNVSDFTHAYLHRKYQPFTKSTLTRLEARDDKVYVSYRTKVGGSRLAKLFLDDRVDRSSIDLCYDYPYQWSVTGGKIKHWCFVLPIDESRSRCFFLFMFDADVYRVPFLPVHIKGRLLDLFLRMARRTYIEPLLDEDRVAIEAEQDAHDRLHDAPIPELNPAVREFQRLTIDKWTEHVAGARQPARKDAR